MTTAAPIQLHPTIPQRGPLGYLLWLRTALPAAYVVALHKVPAVAAFENALHTPLGCCGIGQVDDDTDLMDTDVSDDTLPEIDVTAYSEAPSTVLDDTADTFDTSDSSVLSPDYLSSTPPIDTSVVAPATPTLPSIAAAPSAAATVAASSSMSSALPAIAQIVAAVAPVAVASLNLATAQTNASTVAKTQGAAQLQLQQALSGQAPYQTGIVQGANGAYIAAINPVSPNSLLSSTLGGIPIWLLALGGVGAALLMME
jgi:hypothetical protein